jgi:hypothetical protein
LQLPAYHSLDQRRSRIGDVRSQCESPTVVLGSNLVGEREYWEF